MSVTATVGTASATSTSSSTVTAIAVAATSVEVVNSAMTMYVGETGNITYTLSPDPCYENVSYQSANTGIATVDASGLVTGVAVGTTTVTLSAARPNGATSITTTVQVTVKNRCKVPSISFNNTNNMVTITSETNGATIHYTTDGTNPTTSSPTYSAPFSLTSPATIKAIAVKDGYDNSELNSREVIEVATPTFTQNGNEVQITSTSGSTIYYTVNNSAPSATNYAGSGASPLTVSGLTSGVTVRAIAMKDQNINSSVSSFVYREQVPSPTITFTPIAHTTTATTSLSCTLAGVSCYYTTDGSEPTTASTLYTGSFTVADNTTVKVIAVKANYNNSQVVSETYAACQLEIPAIVMTSGGVTFASTDDNVTFRYTTGTTLAATADPTEATGTEWGGSALSLTNGTAVKAIAVRAGCQTSEVASTTIVANGVSGGIVTLNDLEDHNWSYYLPNGGIDASYNYPDKLCSPYPRNVKITYYGNGLVYTGADGGSTTTASGVAVSATESENTFVYYKTLERDANNRFPYELIPNPFSKRPTYSSDATTTWRGFYKWRVKSVTGGTIYDASTGGTAQAVGSLLDAETQYYFQPSDNTYTNANNALSMQVELEAVWARAYRVTCAVSAISTNLSSSTFTGGSVERNFLVVNSGTSSSTTINNTSQVPVTVTMVEPDGSSDYRTSTRYINPKVITANNDLKFENININAQVGDAVTGDYWSMTGSNSTMIYANMKNLTMGRGVDNTTAGGIVAYEVVGYNSTSTTTAARNTSGGAFDYHVRVESGNYYFLTSTQNWKFTYYPGLMTIKTTYGCDYDRAKDDNDKMKVRRRVYGGNGTGFSSNENVGHETIVHVLKSGNLGSDLGVGNGDMQTSGNTDYNGSVYFGVVGYHAYNNNSSYPSYTGIRSFYMEGGIVGNLNGGCDTLTGLAATDEAVRIRMKGGTVRGALYGAATQSQGKGFRRFILTGGTVQGWIAGGADGTAVNYGQTNGASYIYVGGNLQANSGGSTTVINRAVGGNVFGAGCGYSATSTSGQMRKGSNVVIADNAYVERGVYGGGSYGFCSTDQTANIYILGGTVAGQPGGVDGTTYDATIQGGVYGGACQNMGGNANIYMTGGIVKGGIYGGSNSSGTLSGNTVLHLDGGQVGTSTTSANVHGGGYGSSTTVSGTVSVSVGPEPAGTDKTADKENIDDLHIYGDVYGGAALGTTTGATMVTMYSGTIDGSLYGGALGTTTAAATQSGTVSVVVNGGKVTGAVYGGSNINCNQTNPLGVTVNGSYTPESGYAIEKVFGGGNGETAASSGQPGAHSTNTAGTTVTVTAGSIHEVYGGGNAATVEKTAVTINGGHHGTVFGGGRGAAAVVQGDTHVTLGGNTHIDANVYGGGNAAQVSGNTYVKIQ